MAPSDLLRQCPYADEKGCRPRDRLSSWPFTISTSPCTMPLQSRPRTPLQKFHFLDISPETDRSFRKSPYKLREIHFDTSSGIGVDRANLYPFPYNHPRFQSRELLFLTCYSQERRERDETPCKSLSFYLFIELSRNTNIKKSYVNIIYKSSIANRSPMCIKHV